MEAGTGGLPGGNRSASLLTLKQPPFRPPFENWVLPMSLVTGHPLLPKGAGGLQGVAKQ